LALVEVQKPQFPLLLERNFEAKSGTIILGEIGRAKLIKASEIFPMGKRKNEIGRFQSIFFSKPNKVGEGKKSK